MQLYRQYRAGLAPLAVPYAGPGLNPEAVVAAALATSSRSSRLRGEIDAFMDHLLDAIRSRAQVVTTTSPRMKRCSVQR